MGACGKCVSGSSLNAGRLAGGSSGKSRHLSSGLGICCGVDVLLSGEWLASVAREIRSASQLSPPDPADAGGPLFNMDRSAWHGVPSSRVHSLARCNALPHPTANGFSRLGTVLPYEEELGPTGPGLASETRPVRCSSQWNLP
jgi:hypothetical protein